MRSQCGWCLRASVLPDLKLHNQDKRLKEALLSLKGKVSQVVAIHQALKTGAVRVKSISIEPQEVLLQVCQMKQLQTFLIALLLLIKATRSTCKRP